MILYNMALEADHLFSTNFLSLIYCLLVPFPALFLPSVASLKWIIFTLTKTIAYAARSTMEITEEKSRTDSWNVIEECEPERIVIHLYITSSVPLPSIQILLYYYLFTIISLFIGYLHKFAPTCALPCVLF